jgi:hypothetical protein
VLLVYFLWRNYLTYDARIAKLKFAQDLHHEDLILEIARGQKNCSFDAELLLGST